MRLGDVGRLVRLLLRSVGGLLILLALLIAVGRLVSLVVGLLAVIALLVLLITALLPAVSLLVLLVAAWLAPVSRLVLLPAEQDFKQTGLTRGAFWSPAYGEPDRCGGVLRAPVWTVPAFY